MTSSQTGDSDNRGASDKEPQLRSYRHLSDDAVPAVIGERADRERQALE